MEKKSATPFEPLGPEKEQSFGFSWSFLVRFYKLHGILFTPIISTTSVLFVFLLGMVLLEEFIVYRVGLISSGFYKVLGERDEKGFWEQTGKSVALILAVSFVKSITQYTRKVMTVAFRKILCQAAHSRYFADDIRFYQMNVLDKEIDNPDQRMTQDIDKFTVTYCEVLPKLLVSPFTIGYYCYEGYLRSGWQGPVGCFIFFLVATLVNKLLMGPVIDYVVKQEKCEGDFRFLHMLIRVHSESIAFHGHGASIREREKVEVSLDKLAETQLSLYWRQFFLEYFVNFVDYIGSIFSYLMLAIPIFFTGEHDDLSPIDLSVLISQNAFILIYLIFTFTSVVDLSGKFADVAGVTHRIAMLLERLQKLESYWDQKQDSSGKKGLGPSISDMALFEDWTEKKKDIRRRLIQSNSSAALLPSSRPNLPIWSIDNLTFSNPCELSKNFSTLISKLNLEISVGQSILISGPSSAGKSSLFRILRGLWPFIEGNLKRHHPPGPSAVFYAPQRPYLTWGTLREQISFPLEPNSSQMGGDDTLLEFYLDKLKLSPVLKRIGGLDVECSWGVYDSLSPGEIQRICLLRVIYHQPVVAVLDEATSSLPMDIEEYIYSEFKRLGITLISVGHRDSIRKYHDKHLILDSKGGWVLKNIEEGD